MQNGNGPITTPTADQPRFSTAELTRQDQPASMQYRVSGIKSYGSRQPSMRSTRGGNRSF